VQDLISIVMPTLNRADALKVVLPSLAQQTYPADGYEILLVDSGSTDGTEELIRELSIQNLRFYKMEENKGRSGARNRGIQEAKGSFILFTDADIIADQNLIASHAAFQERFPGTAAVGCEVQVNTLEEYEEARTREEARRTLHPSSRKRLTWLYFLTGNAFVPREALLKAGMFDEAFTGYGHEDLELGYRLERQGVSIRYNPGAINYHWHPVAFEEQCRKMHLAGISTVRFVNKHRDFGINLRLGMTPLSLTLHSLISPGGWLLRHCERQRTHSHFCREIILQFNYLNGVKEALRSKKG